MPDITEADRAAASALVATDNLINEPIRGYDAPGYLDGSNDAALLVQAFAAHREATEAAFVAWLRGGEFTVYGRPVTVATLREIANQIEAGAHKC